MVRPLVSALALSLLVSAPAVRAAEPSAAVHVPFMEGKPFAEVLKRAKAEKRKQKAERRAERGTDNEPEEPVTDGSEAPKSDPEA